MSLRASKILSTTRMVVFSTTLLFSLIVMSICANLISITPVGYYKFSGLALATSLFSYTLAIMLVVDLLRQGSVFSYIIVEISWLSFLWIFWLSTGSYAAWTDGQLTNAFPGEGNCYFGFFSASPVVQACHDIKAIAALSFLTWILLMSYSVTLLFLAIRAQDRGNSAWTTGVRDGVLFYSLPSRSSTKGAAQVLAAPPTISFSPPAPQQPMQQQFPSEQPYPPYPSSYPSAQV
ncbi:hypothetical protein BGY98DRAFT_947091 [Russula aff. rugulosa BPL654]|nr:hypothetical protein BGY98DRAFT_947091 [Russula aff. rugulosa BPL654]